MNIIFSETKLKDLWLVKSKSHEDNRGDFSRIFCYESFYRNGLETQWNQISSSLNLSEFTLRGMHLQIPPYSENKLVRCLNGKIFDVAIDLRVNSPTFGQNYTIILTGNDHNSLYIPKGFAHGYLTLENNSTVEYLISEKYMPNYSIGIRWNDPNINISWPESPNVISEKDSALPYIIDLNPDNLVQYDMNS